MDKLDKIIDTSVNELLKTTEGRKFLMHLKIHNETENKKLRKLLTESVKKTI